MADGWAAEAPIVQFIETRFAEVEEAALAAARWLDQGTPEEPDAWLHQYPYSGLAVVSAEVAHIDRHRPARVLRDLAAKRVMLANLTGQPYEYRDDCDDNIRLHLRALAAPWSDHPEFDPRWTI